MAKTRQKPLPIDAEPVADPDEEARAQERERVRKVWKQQIADHVLARLGSPDDLLKLCVGLHQCGTQCRVDVWRRLPPGSQDVTGAGLPVGEPTLLSSNKLTDSFFLRLASVGDTLKVLSSDPEIVQKYGLVEAPAEGESD